MPPTSARLSRIDLAAKPVKIQGNSVRAIRVAEGVMRTRIPKADLAKYKIDVLREGDSLLVLFEDKDRKPGTRGIVPGRPPSFERMTLKADDLTVQRSSFSR